MVKIGSIGPTLGPKLRHMLKFGGNLSIYFSLKVLKNYFKNVICQIWGNCSNNFSLKVSKNYISQLLDIYVVKNVLNVVSLVKIGNFRENGKNCVILGAKMTSYVKILGKRSNTFFSKSF